MIIWCCFLRRWRCKCRSRCMCQTSLKFTILGYLWKAVSSIFTRRDRRIIASEASLLVVQMEVPVYIYLYIYIVRQNLFGPRVALVSFPAAPPTRVISRERGSAMVFILGPSTPKWVLGLNVEGIESRYKDYFSTLRARHSYHAPLIEKS